MPKLKVRLPLLFFAFQLAMGLLRARPEAHGWTCPKVVVIRKAKGSDRVLCRHAEEMAKYGFETGSRLDPLNPTVEYCVIGVDFWRESILGDFDISYILTILFITYLFLKSVFWNRHHRKVPPSPPPPPPPPKKEEERNLFFFLITTLNTAHLP